MNVTPNGTLTYLQRNLFRVPRLNLRVDLKVRPSGLTPGHYTELRRDMSDESALTGELSYRIGLLNLSVKAGWSHVDGYANKMIKLQLNRSLRPT